MSEKKPTSKKKKHLHRIVTEAAADGSFAHHHEYKDHPDDPVPNGPPRMMATSATPEEAGQHVAEQFAQNQGVEPGPSEEAAPEAAAPAAGGE